ncbi:MAG: DMT family transporter [Dehalococcoidaceae bacterium]|nr:DMT family transporter [Dehalococcoidaceae bacterium]
MKKAYLILATGVIAISFAAVFIRLADAPSLVIAAYRMTLAAMLLVPVFIKRRSTMPENLKRTDIIYVIFAGIFLSIHFALWITSLEYTTIASSVVLVTAHPAFVVLFSFILFKEKPGRASVLGIFIAFAGVLVINHGSFDFGSTALKGNVMALVAGMAMGAYLVTGRHLKDKLPALKYLTTVYAVSAVILAGSVIAAGKEMTGYSLPTYAMLVLIALVPQLIGHSCLNLAVRMIPATVVSIAILGEPAGAALLGWAVLGEIPRPVEIIGGLIILGGIYIVMRYNRPQVV